jgi:hypothetical protein
MFATEQLFGGEGGNTSDRVLGGRTAQWTTRPHHLLEQVWMLLLHRAR